MRPILAAALVWSVLLCSTLAYEAGDIIRVFKRSQAELEAGWSYKDSTVCNSAGVHGRVEKRALGSVLNNILNPNNTMMHMFQQAGMPIFTGKQIYISHRYKFIYIRNPKSSSSSTLAAIKAAYCEENPECSNVEYQKMAVGSINDTMWQSYFVFTVVRNPIARMLSTYNMFRKYLRRVQAAAAPGESCNIPFSSFAEDVARLQHTCSVDKCCAWVPLQTTSQYTWRISFPSAHMMQQAHTTFTPDGDSIVDYIARTERIDEDWMEIQRLIAERNGGGRSSIRMPYENPQGNHTEIQADATLAHPCLPPDVVAMRILNETTAFGLAKQFAMDMQMFKFMDEGR